MTDKRTSFHKAILTVKLSSPTVLLFTFWSLIAGFAAIGETQNNLFIDLPMPFLVKSVELHPKRNPAVNQL